MQHLNSKKLLRILAMVLVLVMALGCFAACGNDSGKDDDGKGSANGNKVSYEWKGLHYSLSKDFKDTGIGGDQYGSYSNDTLILTVADDITPDGVTDSQSYATHYKNQMSSIGSVSVASANGVYYTVVDYGDGTKEARGFYVDGDHCWVMYITSYDYDQYSSKIVSIITSGTIGSYSSNNGGSNSGNNSGNNGNTGNNGNIGNNDNAGNNGNSGSSNNPADPGNSANPNPDKLNQYSYDGLTYYLGKDFDCEENKSRMKHTSGTTTIWVAGASTPSNVTDGRSFADFYVAQAQNAGYTATRRYQNGVYYTVTEFDDGITEARAFYFYNNYGWCIYATSDHYTSESAALVQYITSGVIDKDYQHNSGNSNSSGSSTNSPVDPGDPNPPSSEKPTEPDRPVGPSVQQPVINGTQYSFSGLTYQLGKDYNSVNLGEYMMHSNGSTSIVVMGGTAENTSSKELAMQYHNKMKDSNLHAQIGSKNRIYYVTTDLGDGTVEVRGFYTDGVRFWNIYATTYDFDKEESILISYITSGVID